MSGKAQAVRQHVDDIVASDGFARSKKLAAFLRWLVEHSLNGDTESITERHIATGVYGRSPDFDPKLDGTVRAEAIRLRHKLREYYASAAGPQRIDVPKGGYLPVFSGFDLPEPVAAAPVTKFKPPDRPNPSPISTRVRWAGAFILLFTLLTLGWRNEVPTRMPEPGLQRATELTEEAKQLIQRGDDITADDRLNKAILLAPNSSEAHRQLSRVLMNLGRDSETVSEARLAETLAPAGSTERREANAQRRSVEGDIQGALAVYAQLAAANPRSFDLLFYLARNQIAARRFDEGLATIDRARRLPEAAYSPELDRFAAFALASLAMCEAPSRACPTETPEHLMSRAHATVQRARAIATAVHSEVALGRVLLLEGGLEANMGLIQDSIDSLKTSGELCANVDDDLCVAASLRVEGNRRVAFHRYTEALQLYGRAMSLALRWQNRGESLKVLEGIEAATDGIHQLEGPDRMSLLIQPEWPLKEPR